jgi:hypothetical protein
LTEKEERAKRETTEIKLRNVANHEHNNYKQTKYIKFK